MKLIPPLYHLLVMFFFWAKLSSLPSNFVNRHISLNKYIHCVYENYFFCCTLAYPRRVVALLSRRKDFFSQSMDVLCIQKRVGWRLDSSGWEASIADRRRKWDLNPTRDDPKWIFIKKRPGFINGRTNPLFFLITSLAALRQKRQHC